MASGEEAEKAKQRKKQIKKMGKLLATIWELDADFHHDLTAVGKKIDQESYSHGKAGWHEFAKHVGGIYQNHITSKTKLADAAKQNLKKVEEIVGAMNERLGKIVATAPPLNQNGSGSSSTGKRKAPASSSKKTNDNSVGNGHTNNSHSSSSKKPKTDLEDREHRALDQLRQFILEKGGGESLVHGYRCRATRKVGNRFDLTFYDPQNRRFRSMLQVARFHKLVADHDSPKRKTSTSRKPSSKGQEAEMKKLRKEIENLRKMQNRATKALNEWDSTHPEEKDDSDVDNVFPTAAARIPDFTGFPGLPDHCTPDVLMAWDFLCTFDRTLSLTPLELDDFARALCYRPPEGQVGDDVASAPVYIVEAHLGLLRFLYSDRSSDEWWWANLETEETEGLKAAEKEEMEDVAYLHFNLAAALTVTEDPLITQSWLQALEQPGQSGKLVVHNALRIVSNKWIAAYLRKCLKLPACHKAVSWLVRRMRQARLDLVDGAISETVLNAARAKAVEESEKQMEQLGPSAPRVSDDDVTSDWEDEEDESDDESDNDQDIAKDYHADSERPASVIPPKPRPALVDLLLPPEKPSHDSEFVNPFTWSHMVGATVARILHRKKRLLNEMDDSLRDSRELSHLMVEERRKREAVAASRVLTECGALCNVEAAIDLLCKGGNYLDLEPAQRICVLRLLIEAAYDTKGLEEVMRTNYTQRTSAMKALEVEQRKAKRDAKEKATAYEKAARQRLASDARHKFIDEKREEIRQLNARSNEFPDDIIDSFADEEIIDFDDDVRADYDALPTPESFSKQDVARMVVKLQEEAAFDTPELHVLTMDELHEQETKHIERLEKELSDISGDKPAVGMDREVCRSVDRLRKEIEWLQSHKATLAHQREKAIEQVKDAMADGTIKALRTAVAAAKKAKLLGNDELRGGVWVLDIVRSAGLELENAKQNKRVFDAQKDLIAKKNRCFIRTEPVGYDCHGNRFWSFKSNDASDERMHVWTETELHCSGNGPEMRKPPPGCLQLGTKTSAIAYGEEEQEDDLVRRNVDETKFKLFSRKEHHSAGFAPTRCTRLWGCHTTEDSLRAMIKSLDSRIEREEDLKTYLKETLEETVGTGEKPDGTTEHEEADEHDDLRVQYKNDETFFATAKSEAHSMADISSESVDGHATGIGANVRTRQIVDGSKDPPISRYDNGTVNAWKLVVQSSSRSGNADADEDEMDVSGNGEKTPLWRVATERGHVIWLTSKELVESLSRYVKWKQEPGYFENDAAFFAYRNHLGRFCGRAPDAPFASSPFQFAKSMLKREADLYPKLKIRSYDNSWGGQSGARALWTNSMRDYAFDFETVRQGLLTLEEAFFDLTLGFSQYSNVHEPVKDVRTLVEESAQIFDIELESMDQELPGLWNTPTSRAVFLYIVKESRTTGFLALALNLLCRNTIKYLQTHKLMNVAISDQPVAGTRVTRRMNAWQQLE